MRILLGILFFLTTACSMNIEYANLPYDSLSGSVASESVSQNSTLSSCTSSSVSLYTLNSVGQKDELVATTTLETDGSYRFENLRDKGFSLSSKDKETTKYIVEFSCDSESYQRFVTGVKEQNISSSTSLFAWLGYTAAGTSVLQQSASSWESLYSQLGSSDTLTEAFSRLNSDNSLKSSIESTFGISLGDLLVASPQIQSTNVPLNLNEGQTQQFSALATHWSLGYDIAYLWKIGSTVLSSNHNFTYTPSANSQGAQVLQLFIGKDDGAGAIDVTKSYLQKSFNINIANALVATPPVLTITSAFHTNSTIVDLNINTGAVINGRASHCATFSGLALREDSFTLLDSPPNLFADYSIDCNQSPNQALSVTLSGDQGLRYIKLWAMDAAGNISSTAQMVSVNYDTVAPQLTLIAPQGAVDFHGGQNISIQWNTIEANPGLASLDYSLDNGVTWSVIAAGIANSGSYNWTAPLVDSSAVRVRVSLSDLAGNSASVSSTTNFTIDSMAPAAPAVSLASSAITKNRTADLAVTCIADFDKIFIAESSTAPSETDVLWQNCAATSSFQVSAGDGTKTIYIWAKDAAGNVGSYASVNFVLDQTAPTLNITSALNAANPGGGSYTMTWTLADAHMTSVSLNMDYSVDGGANWISILTGTANDGSETINFPNIDSTNFRLKLSTCDDVNNCTATLSSIVTVDNQAPTISGFQLAGGSATTALPTVTAQLTAADNNSVAFMRLSELPTYANDGWITYAANFNHTLTLTNGAKTVYIWVKDAAGNVSSASASYNIALDFGTPPTVVITAPGAGETYTTGNLVNIQWTCTNTNGLAASPISIDYTTDDTVTFTNIASSLGNSGSYSWSLPVALNGVPFRVRVNCSSVANVVSSALSQFVNTSGWSVYAGDATYGEQNVNATVADMSSTAVSLNRLRVASDFKNNIYYIKNSAVMKIDFLTGLVTTFLGKTQTSGCTLADGGGGVSGLLSGPRILGLDSTKTYIYIYSLNCAKIFRIHTQSLAIQLWSTPPANFNSIYLTQNKTLVAIGDDNKGYRTNLNVQNSPWQHIYGTGNCSLGQPPVTNDARLIDNPVRTVPSSCATDFTLFANDDATKVWINPYTRNGFRLDYDGSKYGITNNSLWSRGTTSQGCVNPGGIYVYCRNRANGRSITVFNLLTESWEAGADKPFLNNDSSGYLGLGEYDGKLIALYSLNELDVITPNIGGSWTFTTIAGQNYTNQGNGMGVVSQPLVFLIQ